MSIELEDVGATTVNILGKDVTVSAEPFYNRSIADQQFRQKDADSMVGKIEQLITKSADVSESMSKILYSKYMSSLSDNSTDTCGSSTSTRSYYTAMAATTVLGMSNTRTRPLYMSGVDTGRYRGYNASKQFPGKVFRPERRESYLFQTTEPEDDGGAVRGGKRQAGISADPLPYSTASVYPGDKNLDVSRYLFHSRKHTSPLYATEISRDKLGDAGVMAGFADKDYSKVFRAAEVGDNVIVLELQIVYVGDDLASLGTEQEYTGKVVFSGDHYKLIKFTGSVRPLVGVDNTDKIEHLLVEKDSRRFRLHKVASASVTGLDDDQYFKIIPASTDLMTDGKHIEPFATTDIGDINLVGEMYWTRSILAQPHITFSQLVRGARFRELGDMDMDIRMSIIKWVNWRELVISKRDTQTNYANRTILYDVSTTPKALSAVPPVLQAMMDPDTNYHHIPKMEIDLDVRDVVVDVDAINYQFDEDNLMHSVAFNKTGSGGDITSLGADALISGVTNFEIKVRLSKFYETLVSYTNMFVTTTDKSPITRDMSDFILNRSYLAYSKLIDEFINTKLAHMDHMFATFAKWVSASTKKRASSKLNPEVSAILGNIDRARGTIARILDPATKQLTSEVIPYADQYNRIFLADMKTISSVGESILEYISPLITDGKANRIATTVHKNVTQLMRGLRSKSIDAATNLYITAALLAALGVDTDDSRKLKIDKEQFLAKTYSRSHETVDEIVDLLLVTIFQKKNGLEERMNAGSGDGQLREARTILKTVNSVSPSINNTYVTDYDAHFAKAIASTVTFSDATADLYSGIVTRSQNTRNVKSSDVHYITFSETLDNEATHVSKDTLTIGAEKAAKALDTIVVTPFVSDDMLTVAKFIEMMRAYKFTNRTFDQLNLSTMRELSDISPSAKNLTLVSFAVFKSVLLYSTGNSNILPSAVEKQVYALMSGVRPMTHEQSNAMISDISDVFHNNIMRLCNLLKTGVVTPVHDPIFRSVSRYVKAGQEASRFSDGISQLFRIVGSRYKELQPQERGHLLDKLAGLSGQSVGYTYDLSTSPEYNLSLAILYVSLKSIHVLDQLFAIFQ